MTDLEPIMEPCAYCGHTYDVHLHLRDGMDCGRCRCTAYSPKLSIGVRVYLWLAKRGYVKF